MRQVYEVTRSIEINARPADCYRVLCDFENYSRWTSFVKAAEVTGYDEDTGRGSRVAYTIHVIIPKTYQLILEYAYEDEKNRLNYASRGGDIRSAQGHYQFRQLVTGKTLMVFNVNIDFGQIIPAPIINLLTGKVMDNFLSAIKNECESRT